jgi:uncharacterized protein YbjT (DUF2867 family)
VGQHCLDLALDHGAWDRVRTVGRRAPDVDHPHLDAVTAPLGEWAEHPDAFTSAAVVCALGTTIRAAGSQDAFRAVDCTAPLVAARQAKDRGASTFVLVSSSGADAASRGFYLRVKGELERELEALDFTSLTILRPSILLGPRRETRPLESIGKVVIAALSPLLVGRLRRVRGVRARAVAHAAVEAAAGAKPGVHIVESEEIAASYPPQAATPGDA